MGVVKTGNMIIMFACEYFVLHVFSPLLVLSAENSCIQFEHRSGPTKCCI